MREGIFFTCQYKYWQLFIELMCVRRVHLAVRAKTLFPAAWTSSGEKNAYLLDKIVIFDLRPAKHKTIEKKMLPFTRAVLASQRMECSICAVARFLSRRIYKWSNALSGICWKQGDDK